MTTIRSKVSFRRARRHVVDQPQPATLERRDSSLARRLALAHYIERQIEDGRIRDYADAARRLGITRARMTQVMDLALLPVEEQERILVNS